MKKVIFSLYILSLIPFLCGCGMADNYREVESLMVVRTMGIDSHGRDISVTLASAPEGEEGKTRLLNGSGVSVTDAMEDIYDRSYEKELFCYHVGQIIIGEALAEEGMDNCLQYICRSRDMRLDSPLFVAKGEAGELISHIGGEGKGAAQVIDGLETRSLSRGGSRIFSAGDVICALKRNGSALICAVESADASETVSGEEGGTTAKAAGYAVIRGDRLCGYISEDDALAVDILRNTCGTAKLTMELSGRSVTVELCDGGATLLPDWQDGELLGMKVNARATVSLLDGETPSDDALISRTEEELARRINSVLGRSRSLNADFLGLASIIERESPARFREMSGNFSSVLPTLGVTVTVSAALAHENDMEAR